MNLVTHDTSFQVFYIELIDQKRDGAWRHRGGGQAHKAPLLVKSIFQLSK